MGKEEEGQLADYVAYTIHVGQYTNTIHVGQYTPIQCMCAEGIGQDLNKTNNHRVPNVWLKGFLTQCVGNKKVI